MKEMIKICFDFYVVVLISIFSFDVTEKHSLSYVSPKVLAHQSYKDELIEWNG